MIEKDLQRVHLIEPRPCLTLGRGLLSHTKVVCVPGCSLLMPSMLEPGPASQATQQGVTGPSSRTLLGEVQGTCPSLLQCRPVVNNVSQGMPAALQRAACVPRHEWHLVGFKHLLPLLEVVLVDWILSFEQLTWLSVSQ